jgi:hypothetical protein
MILSMIAIIWMLRLMRLKAQRLLRTQSLSDAVGKTFVLKKITEESLVFESDTSSLIIPRRYK